MKETVSAGRFALAAGLQPSAGQAHRADPLFGRVVDLLHRGDYCIPPPGSEEPITQTA